MKIVKRRVCISGFEFVYADGQSDRVPWKYVCAYGTGIGFSSIIRELHPRLPQVVHFTWSRPERVIGRLRERAVAREMRCGTYRDYFVVPRPPRGMIAMIIGWLIIPPLVALRYGWQFTPTLLAESIRNELPFTQWAALSAMELWIGGMCTLIWACYPLMILHCRRELLAGGVLAFETDAASLTLHQDDGRCRALPWSDLEYVDARGRMRFSDDRDYRLPGDALARWTPLIRVLRKRTAAARSPEQKIPWAAVAYPLLAALPIAALAGLLPGSEFTPLSMIAKVLAAGGALAACLAVLFRIERKRATAELDG